MKRYEEYKDSGVQWIGEIPSAWQSCKLVYTLRQRICDGPHETPNLVSENEGIPFISIDSLNDSENIDFSVVKKFISNKDYQEYKKKANLEEGDILFSKSATIGKTAIVPNDIFMVWSPLAIIKPNKDTDNKYLYYLLNCKPFIEEVMLSGSFNTQANVGMRELEKVSIPYPSFTVQQSIASFLDAKTKPIDNIMSKRKKQIELLEEMKSAIISRAVTKGLNPDAKMKNSGIDGVGFIPEHWNKTRFVYSSWIRSRLGWRALKADEYQDSGYPFLSAFNIVDNKLIWDEFNYITQERFDESPEIKLNVGDILLLKDGAGLGKCARVDELPEGSSTVNGSLAVITPTKGLSYKYLYYYLLGNTFKQMIDLLRNGMGVPHFTQGNMRTIYLPLPPFDEQEQIASHLDSEIVKLDTRITKRRKQIELLQEYKQALITDAITGKIDVRGFNS